MHGASKRAPSGPVKGTSGARDAFADFLKQRELKMQSQARRLEQQDKKMDERVVPKPSMHRESLIGSLPHTPAPQVGDGVEAVLPSRRVGPLDISNSFLHNPISPAKDKRSSVASTLPLSSLGVVQDTELPLPVVESDIEVIIRNVWSVLNLCPSGLQRSLDGWFRHAANPSSSVAPPLEPLLDDLWVTIHRTVFYCINVLSPDERATDSDTVEWIIPLPLEERSQGSSNDELHTMLHSTERIRGWVFILRCLAEMNYPREEMFTQTPDIASDPQELVLAMLWLTKRYMLCGVALLVSLRAKAAFLFPSRLSEGIDYPQSSLWPSSVSRCLPTTKQGDLSDKPLLEQCAAHRLEQIQRILPTDQEVSSLDLSRRLLGLRKLCDVSLGRVESLLHQRAVLVEALGASHSMFDYALCLSKHDVTYRRIIEGLEAWRKLPQEAARIRDALRAVSDNILSFVRRDGKGVETASVDVELIAALREDAILEANKRRPAVKTANDQDQSSPVGRCLQDDLDEEVDAEGVILTALRDTVERFCRSDAFEKLSSRQKWMRRVYQDQCSPQRPGQVKVPQDAEEIGLQQRCQRVRDSVTASMAQRYSFSSCLRAELATLKELDDDSTALPSLDAHSVHNVLKDLPGLGTLQSTRPLMRCGVQEVFVGPPAPGRTTSARVEMEKLLRKAAELEELRAARSDDSDKALLLGQQWQAMKHSLNMRCVKRFENGKHNEVQDETVIEIE